MKKILLLLASILPMCLNAQDFIYDGLKYRVLSEEEKTVEINGFADNEISIGELIIPENVSYNGKTYFVTEIGEAAFANCSGLTSVSISNSVTLIGYDAFAMCTGLTSIDIPNSVTNIRDHAFTACTGLTSVNLGASVTYIGYEVFNICSSLLNINVADTNQNFASLDGVLYSKNLDTILLCPCGREGSFEIPDFVTTIASFAFNGCTRLTSIDIPDSVTEIENAAFSGCSGLTSVTIPNSITSISGATFSGCSGLTNVDLGNSVTSIGYYAFRDCISLTSIDIPDSVTTIVQDAFAVCSGLTSLLIGSSVTSIGERAFGWSYSLEKVVVTALVPPAASDNTFSDVTYNSATLIVPEKSIELYRVTSPWSNFLSVETLENAGVNEMISSGIEECYEIFNLNGQLVKSPAKYGDIKDLNPGIYIINGKKVIVK